jgi:MoxR-like ATPase
VGTRIFNQKTGEFTTWLGPVFTNLLLADEINRSPAKVQSALLEVMQERQVSIGGETFKVEEPFLVMATQNPIETEGTYPLPEAQVDRFMMKVVIDYPNEMEEFVIVERMTGKLEQVQPVLTVQELLELRKEAEQVFTDPALMEYAVKLTVATRDPEKFGLSELKPYITYGASPRSSINLVLAARALAYLRGRSWVLLQDMVDVALDVMRHRLVLSYEALAEGVTSDTILKRILETVPSPREVLKSHAEATYKS